MSHHSARKLLSSPFVPNCRFGKLKRFRTATRPCCARMDVAAVTHGVVNMWVWLKSLQLFCVTQSAEIGPAAAGPAGPAPTALHYAIIRRPGKVWFPLRRKQCNIFGGSTSMFSGRGQLLPVFAVRCIITNQISSTDCIQSARSIK